MQITANPISGQSIWTGANPFFASAQAQQAITPPSTVVVVLGTAVFTTNLPGVWTTDVGSIVAAGDGLSATLTAQAGEGLGSVTVTNQNDPGNTANAPVAVLSGTGATGGDLTHGGGMRSGLGMGLARG